jgi:hypothetical protein
VRSSLGEFRSTLVIEPYPNLRIMASPTPESGLCWVFCLPARREQEFVGQALWGPGHWRSAFEGDILLPPKSVVLVMEIRDWVLWLSHAPFQSHDNPMLDFYSNRGIA